MPDVTVIRMDRDVETGTPHAPKPDPRWVRLWHLLRFPLGFFCGLLRRLWAAFPLWRPR